MLGLGFIIPVSLLGGALCVDFRTSLRLMLSQPICGGLLTGLILGEPFNGLLAGTLIQIMFLGNFFVRGAKTLDLPIAGVISAALFVLVDIKLAGDVSIAAMVMIWALSFGLLAGWFGYFIYRTLFFKLSGAVEPIIKKAMEGKLWYLSLLNFFMVAFNFLYGFVVLMVVLPVGYKTILYFVSTSWRLTGSVELLYIFLPFIGVGSLLRIQILKSQGFWFISGFLISAMVLVFM
ncbi:PTS sugar transporter subunit IIC [bacterium]|nr:PTS sugar transporter subunit IIC [bacterium]